MFILEEEFFLSLNTFILKTFKLVSYQRQNDDKLLTQWFKKGKLSRVLQK